MATTENSAPGIEGVWACDPLTREWDPARPCPPKRTAHVGWSIALWIIIALTLGSVFVGPAFAQPPGIAVDAKGGGVVDPTKNVLDLVLAAVKRLDDLIAIQLKRQDDLRDAESKRVTDLAIQKQAFDFKLAEILKADASEKSLLLAGGLKEAKSDLSDRVAKIERTQWEAGGRTSVTDPATAEALTKMAAAISGLAAASNKTEGVGIGRGEVVAWIVGGAGSLALLIGTAFGVAGFISSRKKAAP